MGFRETFTKSESENVLGYDDSASLYFGGCMLLCLLLPWSYYFLKNLIFPSNDSDKQTEGMRNCSCSECVQKREERKNSSKNLLIDRVKSSSSILQFIVLSLLWLCCVNIAWQLSQAVQIAVFDPFDLLEIDSYASLKDIKRAYRTLSLKWHPDKNNNDPTAAAKFIMISKAYQALTDEVSRSNFEKYGNPDGPGIMKVGIGLPQFLIDKEHQLLILLLFFLVLLVIIPGAFVWYFRRQKKYAPNGILVESLQLIGASMKEQPRTRQLAEIMAASAEARAAVPIRPTDNEAMLQLCKSVDDSGSKRMFEGSPLITKNYFLILGHIQRLHHLLSPALQEDLNSILKHTDVVTHSMLEIACYHGWISTAQAVIDFRRSLIQSLESSTPASSLLQLPHFTQNALRHCLKGKNAAKDLKAFARQQPDERKGLADMTLEQKADVSAFCSSISLMDISVSVSVEDETQIVEGDLVTLTIELTRTQLRENETQGEVHAPLFPLKKNEEWWIFVLNKAAGNGGLVSFLRCADATRVCQQRIIFQAPKKGRHPLHILALCDSYAGLDVVADTILKVVSENEANRDVKVHPDDLALDNQPTLFQQMLGGADESDSSDEE